MDHDLAGGRQIDTGLRSRIGIYVVWMMRTVTPALILLTFVYGGLFNADNTFWGEGANWRTLSHTFRDAVGL